MALRKWLWLPIASVLLLACQGSAPPTPTRSAAAPTTGPVATSAPQPGAPAAPTAGGAVDAVNAAGANTMNNAPTFLGVEKGIFLKNGIDLKLKVMDNTAEMSRALQAGEVSMLAAASSAMPVAREAGIPLIGFVGVMQDATTALGDQPVAIVARKEAGIGEGQFDKLVGKRVGLPTGATGDQYVRAVLAKKNIPAEQVQIINVPSGSQVSAIQTGQVDAMANVEPYPSLVLDKVPGSVLVSRGGGYIGYIIVFAATDETLKSKPDQMERFVTAFAEASSYTRQHLDEAAEITTRWVPGLDVDVARKAIRFVPFDPRISPYSIQAYDGAVEDLINQKKLQTREPGAAALDTSILDKVQRAHPEFFADLKPIP